MQTARYFTRDNPPPVDSVYSDLELAHTPWYYSIEIELGKFTPGQKFPNVGLTRRLLSRTDVKGMSCLDIGTMEALIPVLMHRRGAQRVVAYDRPAALTNRVELVKSAQGAAFDFVAGFPLVDLPARLNHETFDVVVSSGVLYHLFSPLGGLATARGLLRDGGILIVETSAVIDSAQVMYWNVANRFGGESYFLPSTACLDYFARFLRLQVIDCAYLISHWFEDKTVCRVAIACRAVPTRFEVADDAFIGGTLHTETDVAEYLDWGRCASSKPEVSYQLPQHRIRQSRFARRLRNIRGGRHIAGFLERKVPLDSFERDDCRSLDVYRVCANSQPDVVGENSSRLSLADVN